MDTTIKISKETKERLNALDLAGKNKTYDMLVNDLLTFYETRKEKYDKDYEDWKEETEEYKNRVKIYNKTHQKYVDEKEMWDRLLKWAKKQGFKG